METSHNQPIGPHISERSEAAASGHKSDRSDAPLKVFVSSVFEGYEQHREVVRQMV